MTVLLDLPRETDWKRAMTAAAMPEGHESRRIGPYTFVLSYLLALRVDRAIEAAAFYGCVFTQDRNTGREPTVEALAHMGDCLRKLGDLQRMLAEAEERGFYLRNIAS